MAEDFYKILGIDKNASDDEIKSAYRKLAKKYHPDVNKEKGADVKFKEVNEAYSVLSDKNKRAQYDQFGQGRGSDFFKQAGGGFGGGFGGDFGGFNFDFGGFDDIFSSMFGGSFGGSRTRTSAVTGDDIQVQINLSFEEAVLGCNKNINVSKVENCSDCSGTGAKGGKEYSTCRECSGSGTVKYRENSLFGTVIRTGPCKQCDGTGKIIKEKCSTCNGNGYKKQNKTVSINIPAGVDNNQVVTVRGGGNAGLRGGVNGDLHIIVSVANHKLLERENYNLKLKIFLPFTMLVTGGEVKVPLVKGTTKIKIPEYTQNNTVFKLKGKGVKHLNSNTYGDLLVTIVGEVPKGLSKADKELLNKLEASLSNKYTKHKQYLKELKNL